MNEYVRQGRPGFSGMQRHQVLLDLDRVLIPRPPQSVRDSTHVRIDDHAISAEAYSNNHVRSLPAHASESYQLFKRFRDVTLKSRHNILTHLNQAPGFLAKESSALDDILKLLGNC